MGASHWYTALAKSIHGSIVGKLGRNEEAGGVVVGRYRQMAEDDSAASVYVDRSLQGLIDFYRESGNPEAPGRCEALVVGP